MFFFLNFTQASAHTSTKLTAGLLSGLDTIGGRRQSRCELDVGCFFANFSFVKCSDVLDAQLLLQLSVLTLASFELSAHFHEKKMRSRIQGAEEIIN
mmetsp:Transcript_7965/g.19087  ORF Transcript_7965/g.19087 Transcript_7965/m.19087 type:complete len:97 (-) Transcript_7965:157-447(-)